MKSNRRSSNTNTNDRVAVVIPLYKEEPTEDDLIAIRRCFEVLGNYSIVAIKPKELDLRNYRFNFNNVRTFDSVFFSGIEGYNRMMTCPQFYKAFLDVEYILIYQTDAFVFSDQLKFWCDQGYDYIGAPWYYSKRSSTVSNYIRSFKSWIHKKMNLKEKGTDYPSEKQFYNQVGNGGLSLRRTRRFYELALKERSLIDYYNGRPEHFFNEDIFWSIEANRRKKRLRIPDYKIALKFAIEGNPEKALMENNGDLPFGCHAWRKYESVWKEIFSRLGYTI